MSKFGVEIECFGVATVPQEAINLGWIDKDDCSIDGQYSLELVSPPLEFNKENLKQVEHVMKLLREAGGQVNNTCGFHVHIDLGDAIADCHAGTLFDTLTKRYRDLEPFTDTLVPLSRRQSRNTFCHSMEQFSLPSRVLNNQTLSLEGRNDLSYIQRYQKINISAFIVHGTVEIRHFAGTLNGTKATSWIRFCHAFVSAAKRHSRLVNPRVMTTEQWNNPFHGMRNQKAIQYLQQRSAEALVADTEREARIAARRAEREAQRAASASV